MRTPVEHVHEWHRQDVWLLGASEVADVGIERYTLLSSSRLSHSHRNAEDCVGSKLGLVGGAVELVEEGIDRGLILDIDVLLDQSRGNLIVDVGDSLGHAYGYVWC